MVVFDLSFSFLAGGLIGRRSRGTRRDLALLYGSVGVGAPGLYFLTQYPAWDWQYLVDPATLPSGVAPLFFLGVCLLSVLGHDVGHRAPRALVAVALALGIFMGVTAERALELGTYAQWVAGEAGGLTGEFIGAMALLMIPSGLFGAWCWWRSGVGSEPREATTGGE